MLNFEKDFSDVKKVFLSVNYRSQAAIVRGAGCVIKNNKQRFDKQIQAVRPEEEPVDIRVFKGPLMRMRRLSVKSVITMIRGFRIMRWRCCFEPIPRPECCWRR